jgi:hypothetical protein
VRQICGKNGSVKHIETLDGDVMKLSLTLSSLLPLGNI